jgi:preprotein translocase subunit SecY
MRNFVSVDFIKFIFFILGILFSLVGGTMLLTVIGEYLWEKGGIYLVGFCSFIFGGSLLYWGSGFLH